MVKKKLFKVKKSAINKQAAKQDKKKELHFPHIYRFINARFFYHLFVLFLVAGVLGIIAINYLYPTDSLEKARINLFLRPYEARSYINFADLYLQFNDYPSAKRELKTAIYFSKNPQDAQEATEKLLEIERNERSREEIESEIIKWERIISEKHNYRDAYFRLAVLNYQTFKNDKARQYLEKAMVLDPNFEEGKRLRELL